MKTYVQLGRFGDILNILPILHADAEGGCRARLVVANKYLDIMEGVGYCDVRAWPGPFEHLLDALKWSGVDAVNLQVYGHGYKQRRVCNSFCEESWNNGGMLDLFGKLHLVLDRRDKAREAQLVARYGDKRPMVLLGLSGNSSPFPHARALKAAVSIACPEANIVDLAHIVAYRPYDLLGLYDAAKVLVSIDTMHLHLAPASKVPVVALYTDKPTSWHGTPFKPGQIERVAYGSFPQAMSSVVNVVKRLAQ